MTADTKPDVPDAPEEPAKPPPEEDVKMTIWEHLDELRRRLVRSAIAVVVTTGVAWAFRAHPRLAHPALRGGVEERNLPGIPDLQTLVAGARLHRLPRARR